MKKDSIIRYKGILLMYLAFLIISFISRNVLLVMSFSDVDVSLLGLLRVYFIGLFFDTVAYSYFMIPYVLFLLFIPNKAFNSTFHKWFAYSIYSITLFIYLFNGVSEYFFWEEFGVRYNFIAVDYLIYTTEVVGNIQESYPITLIFSSIAIVDLALMFALIRKKVLLSSLNSKSSFKRRLVVAGALLALPILSFIFVNYSWAESAENRNNNELSKNGVYSLFAAFINNELDYETFYLKQDNSRNFTQLKNLIKSENSVSLSNDTFDISRTIKNVEPEKRYNVILITVESLSGEFLGYMGSRRGNITPNLDSLANNAMLFTNLYAVGTRTIWGLEAVALSAPPKPGQSVIKRPHSENMFSLGQIFKSRGYDLKFIYGGLGYFDNMNYFFKNNGYTIVDRKSITKKETTFSNVWGVCDQDLFNKVLQETDKSFAEGKPFFNLVMTTSNHRPFTYPNGFIDIQSPSNRKGGVKYCDYAIGEFIRKAKSKTWFSNTLFVIVADHCAGSAGQTSLPILDYQIPLIIYNPNLIKPQRIDKLSSQIDIGPTILGILNWTYTSKFFGKDILKMTLDEERAFIANYQNLGYIKNNSLMVLSPLQKVSSYRFNRITGDMEEQPVDKNLLDETIVYYQSANFIQKNRMNKWK